MLDFCFAALKCKMYHAYRKTPKNSDTRKICNNKIVTMCFYHRTMRPKDVDRIAYRVDPIRLFLLEQSDLGLPGLLRSVNSEFL